MKTLIGIVAIALSMATAGLADDGRSVDGFRVVSEPAVMREHDYIVNTLLPPDAVELYPDDEVIRADFFATPVPRPPNIPATFVLARVFWHDEFIGYVWLDADVVNELHGIETVQL